MWLSYLLHNLIINLYSSYNHKKMRHKIWEWMSSLGYNYCISGTQRVSIPSPIRLGTHRYPHPRVKLPSLIEGWRGSSLSASEPPPWASEEQPHRDPPWRVTASLMTRCMRWSRDCGDGRLALAPLVQHPFLVTASPSSFGAAALPSICLLWAENRWVPQVKQ